MMQNGLINVFNVPINDQDEIMNFMECRRTLKEILEGVNYQQVRKNLRKAILKWKIPKIERTHNKTGGNKLRKSIRKLNTPEIDMYNKISVIADVYKRQVLY